MPESTAAPELPTTPAPSMPMPHLQFQTAFLGPEGSFSGVAASYFANGFRQAYSAESVTLSCRTEREVFERVMAGEANAGVVATESNVEGFVGRTLDLFLEFPEVSVAGAIWRDIEFDAIALGGQKWDDIKTVRAHSHALAQCQNFIRENYLTELPSSSNSQAAQGLRLGEVALVPSVTSTTFGEQFEILKTDVADFSSASTQFALISTTPSKPDSWQKNIYIFTPENDKPGTLVDFLNPITRAYINITSLFSRPVKGQTGHYAFFITLDGVLPEELSAREDVRHLGGFDD